MASVFDYECSITERDEGGYVVRRFGCSARVAAGDMAGSTDEFCVRFATPAAAAMLARYKKEQAAALAPKPEGAE